MKVFATKKEEKSANILFLCFTVLGEAILTCCMLGGGGGRVGNNGNNPNLSARK